MSDITMYEFWAPWCGPCKVLKPVVEKVEPDFPAVKVVYVNIDEQPDIAKQYQVRGIPSIVAVKDDTPVKTYLHITPSETNIRSIFTELSNL